jgi:L-2,4-diaminobutyrate transaminase
MAGVELVANKSTKERLRPEDDRVPRIIRAAREHGLLVRSLIGNIVWLSPPFITSRDQLERMVGSLRAAICETR